MAYQIKNSTSDHDLGIHKGKTEDQAYDAFLRNAGYDSRETLAEILGIDESDLTKELTFTKVSAEKKKKKKKIYESKAHRKARGIISLHVLYDESTDKILIPGEHWNALLELIHPGIS